MEESFESMDSIMGENKGIVILQVLIVALAIGIIIRGEKFRPIDIRVDKILGANVWLTAGLSEGKNRELRRALEQIGLIVNRLIRTSYGPFQLGFLPRGNVKEVRRKTLYEQVGNLLK